MDNSPSSVRPDVCRRGDLQSTVERSPEEKLANLYSVLSSLPQLDTLRTTHRFADGMYARELFIPAGTMALSKRHARECFFFVLSGDLSVFRSDGVVDRLVGPVLFVVPPTKSR